MLIPKGLLLRQDSSPAVQERREGSKDSVEKPAPAVRTKIERGAEQGIALAVSEDEEGFFAPYSGLGEEELRRIYTRYKISKYRLELCSNFGFNPYEEAALIDGVRQIVASGEKEIVVVTFGVGKRPEELESAAEIIIEEIKNKEGEFKIVLIGYDSVAEQLAGLSAYVVDSASQGGYLVEYRICYGDVTEKKLWKPMLRYRKPHIVLWRHTWSVYANRELNYAGGMNRPQAEDFINRIIKEIHRPGVLVIEEVNIGNCAVVLMPDDGIEDFTALKERVNSEISFSDKTGYIFTVLLLLLGYFIVKWLMAFNSSALVCAAIMCVLSGVCLFIGGANAAGEPASTPGVDVEGMVVEFKDLPRDHPIFAQMAGKAVNCLVHVDYGYHKGMWRPYTYDIGRSRYGKIVGYGYGEFREIKEFVIGVKDYLAQSDCINFWLTDGIDFSKKLLNVWIKKGWVPKKYIILVETKNRKPTPEEDNFSPYYNSELGEFKKSRKGQDKEYLLLYFFAHWLNGLDIRHINCSGMYYYYTVDCPGCLGVFIEEISKGGFRGKMRLGLYFPPNTKVLYPAVNSRQGFTLILLPIFLMLSIVLSYLIFYYSWFALLLVLAFQLGAGNMVMEVFNAIIRSLKVAATLGGRIVPGMCLPAPK